MENPGTENREPVSDIVLTVVQKFQQLFYIYISLKHDDLFQQLLRKFAETFERLCENHVCIMVEISLKHL